MDRAIREGRSKFSIGKITRELNNIRFYCPIQLKFDNNRQPKSFDDNVGYVATVNEMRRPESALPMDTDAGFSNSFYYAVLQITLRLEIRDLRGLFAMKGKGSKV